MPASKAKRTRRNAVPKDPGEPAPIAAPKRKRKNAGRERDINAAPEQAQLKTSPEPEPPKLKRVRFWGDVLITDEELASDAAKPVVRMIGLASRVNYAAELAERYPGGQILDVPQAEMESQPASLHAVLSQMPSD